MSHSKPNTTERSPSSDKIKKNPFFDDFVDCIENLPSRLQLLLSEVRNVDVLVKARHRKLHVLKLEIVSKSQEAASEAEKRMVVDNLLIRMHQLLIQCQTLGDQKIRLTSQIIDLIGSKTRQLGFDPRSSEAKFQLDIDEEKILSEFRLTCKKNRPIHHHYNAANSSVNSRSSTRQFQNLTKAGTKQTVEIGKKVYTKKGPNLHRDMWNDDSSNLDYSPHNATSQLNGHLYVKKKPLNQRVNQPCASFSDSKKSFKKLNESKNNVDENQLTPTRSKRQLNFCKTSTNLAKKSLNQSLKLSRKRRLSLSKKPQSSSSSSCSHQCKSPSSISSFSSLSSCKNKYLTNNTNNGNQSSNTTACKTTTPTLNSDKAQKENIKVNSKTKNNKMVKRLAARGRAKLKKSDTDNANQEDSEYESDDEKSAESDNGTPNEQKNFQIKNEAKEDQLERNSNETESIKNLDEEENEPSNQNEEERPAPRSKRIKQEVDYSDDIRKKSTRITRNNNHNLTETVTKISKSAHDEPLYCTCREISYGQMIMCDNDACQIEWFHFNCVKLTSKPKGKWYCPLCRGDTHKVMKKSHLMQSSASSSLSSPSYYASNYSNRCK